MIVLNAEAFLASLRRIETGILAAVRQALGQAAAYAAEHARRTSKFKDRTGELRKEIGRGVRGPWAVFVRASAKHALFVEEDTKPHIIRARRAKMLRFVQNGRVRFARSVRHPGTKGTHFMRDARDAAEEKLTHFVQYGVNQAIASR